MTCCEAVPENVRVPFCPGVPSGTATAPPPMVRVPVVSGGTAYAVSVMLPVFAPDGSTRIVWPLAKVQGSTNPANHVFADVKVVPLGFRTDNVPCGPAVNVRLTRLVVGVPSE